MIKNPNWQEATSWLQCLVGLNPGQLETNPDQRLGRHLNQGKPHANSATEPLDHASSQKRHIKIIGTVN